MEQKCGPHVGWLGGLATGGKPGGPIAETMEVLRREPLPFGHA